LLLDAGIPAGPIQTVAEALRDPHVRERDMVQQVALSSGDTLEVVASPLKLSQTPPQIALPPPQHGEHTESVLASLGYTGDDISTLRSQGVI
jgi:formyl-CoA transferase/CoA:oxalate CoA-transferase